MKRTLVVAAILQLLVFCSALAADDKISFHLSKVSLGSFIAYYGKLSGRQLVIAANVKSLQRSMDLDTGDFGITQADALKEMEIALLHQAGVCLTPVGNSITSVTYNDAIASALSRATRGHLRKVLPNQHQTSAR